MARKKRNTYGGRYIPVRSGSSKEDTKLCKVQILIQNLYVKQATLSDIGQADKYLSRTYIGVQPSGKAYDFDSYIDGSTPSTPATLKEKTYETQYHKKEKNKT